LLEAEKSVIGVLNPEDTECSALNFSSALSALPHFGE
jgi:hypothetical protein